MPKAEPGTPKWLANKMKAKGLQKLKWYCQMCEKQCRDENGFKCHRLSEAHQRQMQIFCQDANRFMDEYSSMFEKEFMRLMKTRFCRTRVLANTVYTQLISDKTHIHMNSTVWVTLTDFVIYLGNTGKCKIEQTNKGWYIEYIDREKIEREKQYLERKKAEYTYEQLKEKKINDAVEQAKKNGKFIQPEYTGIEKKKDQKIVIASLKLSKNNTTNTISKGDKQGKPIIKTSFNELLKQSAKKIKETEKEQTKKKLTNQVSTDLTKGHNNIFNPKNINNKRPLSTLELLLLENEQKKKKLKAITKIDVTKENQEIKNTDHNQNQNQNYKNNVLYKIIDETNKKDGIEIYTKDKNEQTNSGQYKNSILNDETMKENNTSLLNDMPSNNTNKDDMWICENIVVKIIDNKHKYYKKKGIIVTLIEGSKKKCTVKMEGKEICEAFQKQLQTVIPKIGKHVLILKGKYKGYKARVKKILMENEMVEVMLDGSYSDVNTSVTKRFSYDDVSKLHQ